MGVWVCACGCAVCACVGVCVCVGVAAARVQCRQEICLLHQIDNYPGEGDLDIRSKPQMGNEIEANG